MFNSNSSLNFPHADRNIFLEASLLPLMNIKFAKIAQFIKSALKKYRVSQQVTTLYKEPICEMFPLTFSRFFKVFLCDQVS